MGSGASSKKDANKKKGSGVSAGKSANEALASGAKPEESANDTMGSGVAEKNEGETTGSGVENEKNEGENTSSGVENQEGENKSKDSGVEDEEGENKSKDSGVENEEGENKSKDSGSENEEGENKSKDSGSENEEGENKSKDMDSEEDENKSKDSDVDSEENENKSKDSDTENEITEVLMTYSNDPNDSNLENLPIAQTQEEALQAQAAQSREIDEYSDKDSTSFADDDDTDWNFSEEDTTNTWSCKTCSFANVTTASKCEMCGALKYNNGVVVGNENDDGSYYTDTDDAEDNGENTGDPTEIMNLLLKIIPLCQEESDSNSKVLSKALNEQGSILFRSGKLRCGDSLGNSILMVAAGTGKKHVVQLVIDSVLKYSGRNVSDIARFTNCVGQNAIHYAIASKPVDFGLLGMLHGIGVPINAIDNYGDTPIHLAVKKGNALITAQLLQLGGDPTIRDIYDNNAYTIAEKVEAWELLPMLAGQGEEVHRILDQEMIKFPAKTTNIASAADDIKGRKEAGILKKKLMKKEKRMRKKISNMKMQLQRKLREERQKMEDEMNLLIDDGQTVNELRTEIKNMATQSEKEKEQIRKEFEERWLKRQKEIEQEQMKKINKAEKQLEDSQRGTKLKLNMDLWRRVAFRVGRERVLRKQMMTKQELFKELAAAGKEAMKEEKANTQQKQREVEEYRKKVKEFEERLAQQQKESEKLKKDASQQLKLEAERIAREAKESVRAQLGAEVAALEEKQAEMTRLLDEERSARRKLHNEMEDMKGKIRVYCRVRPIGELEKGRNEQSIVDCIAEDTVAVTVEEKASLWANKDEKKHTQKTFVFDAVFGPKTTQETVFKDTKRLVQSALDGYNVCIFAYGQTGTGKTYTMLGFPGSGGINLGITPRVAYELFRLMGKQSNKLKVQVSLTIVELYNKKLVDLLSDKKADSKESSLKVKKDSDGFACILGATERTADNPAELLDEFHYAQSMRTSSATLMNVDSSRSHLICNINLELHDVQSGKRHRGKISLVDLAGSERVSRSGVAGKALKEAISINESLTALGNVISALGDPKKSLAHVPYRDHILTELMSDSIGGNAKTLMFVNISPGSLSFKETIGSLEYAKRVKGVQQDTGGKMGSNSKKSKKKIAFQNNNKLVTDQAETILALQKQLKEMKMQTGK